VQTWPQLRNAPQSAPSTARFEIGVREDEHRILSAELETDGPQERAALGGDPRAHGRRAGEEDLRDPGSPHELASHFAVALDDLDKTLRRGGERVLDPHRRERSQLGRLDQHRVAASDRGGDLAEWDRKREVPRRDDRDHPERLVVEVRALVLKVRLRHSEPLAG